MYEIKTQSLVLRRNIQQTFEKICFQNVYDRGLTKSAHTVAHGSSGTWISIYPAACSLLDVYFIQLSQFRTYFLTSRYIPGQWYRAATLAIVFRLRICPAVIQASTPACRGSQVIFAVPASPVIASPPSICIPDARLYDLRSSHSPCGSSPAEVVLIARPLSLPKRNYEILLLQFQRPPCDSVGRALEPVCSCTLPSLTGPKCSSSSASGSRSSRTFYLSEIHTQPPLINLLFRSDHSSSRFF